MVRIDVNSGAFVSPEDSVSSCAIVRESDRVPTYANDIA